MFSFATNKLLPKFQTFIKSLSIDRHDKLGVLRFKLYELSLSLTRSINDRHDKLGVFLGWLLLNNDEHDKIR